MDQATDITVPGAESEVKKKQKKKNRYRAQLSAWRFMSVYVCAQDAAA